MTQKLQTAEAQAIAKAAVSWQVATSGDSEPAPFRATLNAATDLGAQAAQSFCKPKHQYCQAAQPQSTIMINTV